MSVNWKIALAVAVIVWIIVSGLWESRERNRLEMAKSMRESYTAREVVDIVFETKHGAAVLYVSYGFLIGAALAGIYIH